MLKFVKPVNNDVLSCICLKCRDSKIGQNGEALLVNSIHDHTGRTKHRDNTPQNELPVLDKLIGDIKRYDEENKVKKTGE